MIPSSSTCFQMNFSSLLKRWFKIYLRQTEQYPSMSTRLLYRYEIQTSKSLLTLGKRQCHDDDHQSTLLKSLHKFVSVLLASFRASLSLQSLLFVSFRFTNAILPSRSPSISILCPPSSTPFNLIMSSPIRSVGSFVSSHLLDGRPAFVVSDQQDKYVSADVGHGLSLLSVTNLVDASQGTWKCLASPVTCSSTLLKKPNEVVEQSSVRVEESQAKDSSNPFVEINEEERVLFDQISKNRLRIQMQHQHLLNRAAQSLCFSSIDRSSVVAQTMH